MRAQNPEPMVSVVVLNYNGKEFLDACLISVLSSEYSNYEVILVDNASTDGSIKLVKEKFGNDSRLKIVMNSENLGFAGGNNIGACHAKGDLLVFLNTDTKVHHEWLGELVWTASSNPLIGISTCRIITPHLEEGFVGNVNKYGFAVLQRLKDILKNGGETIASGPAFLIRKDVFNKIGGFDSKYFAYFEDIDLAWRVKLLGYFVVVEPNSIVFHKVAGTIRKFGLCWRRYLVYRNVLRTLLKNYSGQTLVKVLPVSLTLIFAESIALACVAKNPNILLALTKAILWSIRNFEDTWALHLEIQKNRVVNDSDILRMMAPFRISIPPTNNLN